MLENSRWFVRQAALETLGKVDPTSLAPYADVILRLLDDGDPEVHRASVRTLSKLEPATLAPHVDTLVLLLSDSELVL